MDFRYYDYNQNLFKKIIGKKAEVYLFKNHQDLKKALEVYQPQPLEQQSLFLTLKEFKERLFSSEKIVIKEEKLPLILFSVLTEQEKLELNLESYQDIYQFSARFFSYFNLKNDYQLQEFCELAGWQQKRSKRLNLIKKRYQKRLKDLGYTDQLSLKENKKLNIQFLNDYKKINFFNFLEFTPYFKDILEELNRNFNLELHLQLKEGDFDEKKLELKEITLPHRDEFQIEIKKTSSSLKNLAALLNEIEEESVNEVEGEGSELQVISPGEEIKAANILSEKLEFNRYQSYQETKIYNFLQSLYQLYQQGKKGSKILIELKELYSLTSQNLFREWLGLDSEDLLQIKDLIREDYYYLDQDTLKQKLPSLNSLLTFLKKIRKTKNIQELVELLTSFSNFLLENQNKEIVEKFNDSLLELKSIEQMGVVNVWKDFYSDQGAGLFALFLNHLKYKNITLSKNKETVKFFNLERAPQLKRKKLLINNCTQDHFTSKKDGLFFLSEKQLQDNGLQLKNKKRLIKRYIFLRHIFNSEKAVIFTVENEEQNISPAVILEELSLEYEIKFKESKIEKLSEKKILNNLFSFNEEAKLKVINSAVFNKELKVEKKDFGNSFNFSYYKYKYLKDCYYRFYLEQLVRLDTNLEIKPSLSLMNLGILTHEIFGELIIYACDQKISPSEIPAAVRKEIIKKAIKENELKIDKDYLNYYHQIIFKNLDRSFIRFADLLEKYLPQNYDNILVEWPEWNYKHQKYFDTGGIDFYLSGRIDLLLLKEKNYFIIDFKTGSGDKKQLDFYSLMLRQNYEKKLPAASRKAIYNVFSEDFEHSYNNLEKENKLGTELQELSFQLFKAGVYERVYKSRCRRCPYRDICRVEVKNNEESY